jgi:hypothetical protein
MAVSLIVQAAEDSSDHQHGPQPQHDFAGKLVTVG